MMTRVWVICLTSLYTSGSYGFQAVHMRRMIGVNSTNDRALQVVGVQNSQPFHPTNAMSFLPDYRAPLIQPNACTDPDCCPGNIYNPSVVNNGASCWNIYFGGWDGVRVCKDSVSVAVTLDKFASINPHVPMIATGTCQHVNNPSAVKVVDGYWAMVFSQDNNNINKPGVSLGGDGTDWKPNSGGTTFVIMEGYPFDWGTPTSGADVNGGNVIHFNASTATWHFLFTDFKQLGTYSVFHATGTNGLGGIFNYNGIAVSQPGLVVNDVKQVNGHYILGLHHNGPDTFIATSASLDAPFSAPVQLFSHSGAEDLYITSVGFVIDASGTTLLGALYGAGAEPTLTHNRIFAKWMQKRVTFMSEEGELLWSYASAIGPNVQVLLPAPGRDQSCRGQFHVYDVNHVIADAPGTLLYKSPVVTVTPGEVWELVGSTTRELYGR